MKINDATMEITLEQEDVEAFGRLWREIQQAEAERKAKSRKGRRKALA